MDINIKKLKSILTLSDYEKIENALGLKQFSKNNNQVVFYNADKYKDLSKQSPKLYRYNNTKIYISYTKSCSYDIFGLIQAVKSVQGENYSFVDSINFVLAVTGIDFALAQRLTKKQQYNWENELEKYIKIKKGENILQNYNKDILDTLPKIYPIQWINEGISINTMEKYGIGYYPRLQATTIPCFDRQGNLIGIRCRHWLPEEIENGKYRPLQLLNNKIYKFPTSNVFYGENYNWAEIQRTGQVILVEGEKSVLKADTWWNEKSNVLALYGSNLNLNRIKQLIKLGVNKVILALDSDFEEIGDIEYKEFEKKILKIGEMFKGYASVEVVYNNIGLKNWYKNSPFDGEKETYNKLYESRETIC